jgi:hypothetical protein
MYDQYKVSRGDIVTSARFQYTLDPNPKMKQRLRQVGTPQVNDRRDASASNTPYYIAHVPPVMGDGPGQSQVITALRVEGGQVTEVVQFEFATVCHERVRGDDLELMARKFLAPVKPNCMLRFRADSPRAALLCAFTMYGFVPTSEVQQGQDDPFLFTVSGYEYDKIVYPTDIVKS